MNMNHRIVGWLILGVVLAIPCVASAQMVRGTVTDASTGAPIKSANLSLQALDGRTLVRSTSDDDGKFEMVMPKGTTVYVAASRIGYEALKSEKLTASTAEMVELNVKLSAAPIPLEGITVAARSQVDPRLQEFVERASLYKRAGIGKIWTRKEIEQRHPPLVSHILDHWVIQRRPFGCSGTRVFIDNMPIEYQDDIDLLVAPEQLEGVEIYNDTNIPPDLRSRAMSIRGSAEGSLLPPCKVAMIWRKPYSELNADDNARKPKLWRVFAGAALLVSLLVAERLIMSR